jgi:hypothetical protein
LDGSVQPSSTHKEKKSLKEQREDDFERLLALAFPAGASKKQKTALENTATQARSEGVPFPWMAWAIKSRKIKGAAEPWKRIDIAMADAKRYVSAAGRSADKQFQDLEHLVEYAAGGGNGLPKLVEGVGLQKIIKMATTWPDEHPAVKP